MLVKSQDIFISDAVEAAMFVWGNRPLVATIRRSPVMANTIQVFDWQDKSLVTSFPSQGLALISAQVKDGVLYIMGTNSVGSPGNAIYCISTTDPLLQTWTPPQLIWTAAPDQRIFNTSFCWDTAYSRWILAYEVNEPAFSNFGFRFLQSTTGVLGTWSPLGGLMRDNYGSGYAACPRLDTDGSGSYFVQYLRDYGGSWGMVTIRSNSIDPPSGWSFPKGGVSPNPKFEMVNASDFDMVEWNGLLLAVWSIGDQVQTMDVVKGYFINDSNGSAMTKSQYLSTY